MDITGIVQLVIATILYSTLIAPSIKKMSDLKGEIADIEFPLKTDPDYIAIYKKHGRSISGKMKQYSETYDATSKFLIFLYVAMGISLASQIIPLLVAWINHETIDSKGIINTIVIFVIFVLLVVAIQIFITKPEKVRTFEWLSSVGVTPTYTRDIFNPTLELNMVGKNVRESNNHVHIKLASDLGLYGYNLILTIESIDGERVYHVLAGRVQKSRYAQGGTSYHADGRNRAILDLVHSISLKPGKYKVRLLFFETVFPGGSSPTEVSVGLEVTTVEAKSSTVDINLSSKSPNYSFKVVKSSPSMIEYSENLTSANGLKALLSSSRFQHKFTSTKVMFCFGDSNGMLTYDRIERILRPSRLRFKSFPMIFKRKKPSFKSNHLDLN